MGREAWLSGGDEGVGEEGARTLPILATPAGVGCSLPVLPQSLVQASLQVLMAL